LGEIRISYFFKHQTITYLCSKKYRMSEKKKLFLDMDDVMSDTGQAIIDLYNQHFKTNHSKRSLYTTDLWEEEIAINYLTIRDQLHKPGFFANLAVMNGA